MTKKILCLIATVLMSCSLAGSAVAFAENAGSSEDGYALVVIDDEETALAPRIPEAQLFPSAMIGIGLVVLVILLAAYVMECQKYRARLSRLEEQDAAREAADRRGRSRTIFTLKKQMKQKEDSLVDHMMHF